MWQWCLPYLHHCKFSSTPDTSVMEQTHKASLCLCSCVSHDVRKWHTCCCRPSAEPHQITAGVTVRSCLWEVCVWYVGWLRTDYDSSPTHSLSPSSDEKYKEETFCLGVKNKNGLNIQLCCFSKLNLCDLDGPPLDFLTLLFGSLLSPVSIQMRCRKVGCWQMLLVLLLVHSLSAGP